MGLARRVRTSSDDQNVWMRAINASLGFVPVETEVLFHKDRAPAGPRTSGARETGHLALHITGDAAADDLLANNPLARLDS